MELDKRIIKGKRPLSCLDTEEAKQFIGKEGYFTNVLVAFTNIRRNKKYMLKAIDEIAQSCFKDDDGVKWDYFLPAEWVKEPKKKYRLFSLAEWIEQHEIGEIIHYRSKSEKIVLHHMYVGYAHGIGKDIKKIGVGTLTLGVASYSLDYLFEDYEIEVNGEWKPFGVEE